ncbi:hypothetical protein VPH35_104048 [Triticum aestivum]
MRTPRHLAPTVGRYYATALLLVSQSGRDHLRHLRRDVAVVSPVALGGSTSTRPRSGRAGRLILGGGLSVFIITTVATPAVSLRAPRAGPPFSRPCSSTRRSCMLPSALRLVPVETRAPLLHIPSICKLAR